jgi:glycosyltransferase involved in cell wall biosynthesis
VSIPQIYADNYFKRFASKETLIDDPIDSDCQIIIVIPCHNEPDLIGTLESLIDCQTPSFQVEVIVVVNQKVGNEASTFGRKNAETIESFKIWNEKLKNKALKFHLIEALDMPAKHAGVGLARKTGMDEALRRFDSIDVNGTIVCLDADCRVSENYLIAIAKEFTQSSAGLGEVHFEHQFELETDPNLKAGIINYELFLHYYVEGLQKAGFPYAIQTIGSCMLVKASTYAKHGGMNKRKAGEDFYFLHKIIPHEEFMEVASATVYPSCRTSDRVPFGTGKAQQDWLDQETKAYLTYDPKIFYELESLFNSVESLFQNDIDKIISELPEVPRDFINHHDFIDKIDLIKSNCKNLAQFQKQFYIWFDGFLCMKFVHFVRDHYYPNQLITDSVNTLLELNEPDSEALLNIFRKPHSKVI